MNDFIRQVYKGKTLGRILFNNAVSKHCQKLSGKVLDIAGGVNPSYLKFLPRNIELIRTDVLQSGTYVDMNKRLPFDDEEFDNALFFNAIYIAEKPLLTIKEIRRVLKSGGYLCLSSPFIANEMPEPHDYCRLTHEGLDVLFKKAGFQEMVIYQIGGVFSSATNLLHNYFIFDTIRLVIYTKALLLDKLTRRYQKNYPSPNQYFVIARK